MLKLQSHSLTQMSIQLYWNLFICIPHKDDPNILCTVLLQFKNLLVVNSSNIGLQNG